MIQPRKRKMVKKAPWKMPFGTIIDIHKMSQKIKKILPDIISGAGAGVGKNGAGADSTH